MSFIIGTWALKYCVVLKKGGEGGISDVNYTAKAAVAALEKEMSSEGKIKTGSTMDLRSSITSS